VNESTSPTGSAFDAGRDEPLRGVAAILSEFGASVDARFLAAIHLAGHAIASEACGRAYPPLRLELDAETGCAFRVDAVDEDRGGGPARNGLEAAIIASLAGVEAARLAGGAVEGPCLDVRRWLTDGDPRDAEPYVEWLRLKAERTVEHPLRQRVILAIARALMEQGALGTPEIQALAAQETGRYMRGQ
jgi:hypothetical protein